MYNYFLHARTYFIIKRKQWLELLSIRKGYEYTSFALLCAPRTGSTLLHTYLNFHPHVKSYGEIIREKFEYNPNDEGSIVRKVFMPYSKNLKAIGLKLFYDYYKGEPHYNNAFQEILSKSDMKIIHLVRKDILKLYVSLKIAEKTNVWSTGKSAAYLDTRISIDADDFIRFRKTYIDNKELVTTLFQHHSVLEICYEDLTTDTENVLEKVQQFLGVEQHELKTLLKKQNIESPEKYILNYETVKSAIDE